MKPFWGYFRLTMIAIPLTLVPLRWLRDITMINVPIIFLNKGLFFYRESIPFNAMDSQILPGYSKFAIRCPGS